MTKDNPFKYFRTSPEIIRLAVMLYVRFPLSLRNVEDLLHERGIDISHESVRFWWNRFGPMFAAEIRKKRVERMRSWPHWRWHLDEMFASVHASVHNNFNQERHLYSRQNFKLNRVAALAEWRQLGAA
jgi:putative transposase